MHCLIKGVLKIQSIAMLKRHGAIIEPWRTPFVISNSRERVFFTRTLLVVFACMVLRMLMMMGSRPRFDSMVFSVYAVERHLEVDNNKDGPSTELISAFQCLALGKDLIPTTDAFLIGGLVNPGNLRMDRFPTIFDYHFKNLQGNDDQVDSKSGNSFPHSPNCRATILCLFGPPILPRNPTCSPQAQ